LNKKRLASVLPPALALFFFLFSPPRAEAQIPVTDIAHIAVSVAGEIERYIQAAAQYIQGAESLYNQYKQIEYQVVALKKLNVRSWRDIGPLYHQLQSILGETESLSYRLEGLEDNFKTTFPGVAPYVNYVDDHARQATRTLNTLRITLQGLHQQQQDNDGSLQVLGEIQNHVDAAVGPEQTQEALAELGSWQADQAALIGATQLSIANVNLVAAAYQINERVQQEKAASDVAITLIGASQAEENDNTTYDVIPGWMPV
jgi:P-type conjugative transfer protein TrbJ